MRAIVGDEDVLGCAPRFEGTRVGVVHVFDRYEAGELPEAIAAGYDGVTVADSTTRSPTRSRARRNDGS